MRNIFVEILRVAGFRLKLNEYELNSITMESHISSICDDSLDLLELIMVLEDHFGVNIPSPEKFTTVGELHNFIRRELSNG